MTTHDTPRTTASDAYHAHRQDIAHLMGWLEQELDRHDTDAKAHPKDWGYPGTLGHIRQQLIETVAALSGFENQDILRSLDETRMDRA